MIITYRLNKIINSLSANPRKWSNTLKQLVGKSTVILSSQVYDPLLIKEKTEDI